ncbi:MAG TPA: right-handed parallel beta-helix repeat-containing protein [Allosphingosinicella sp.]|nr:right-handed parallel beta-helix repeat-containing protein [Allosphingosinicella sp.]
MRIRTLFAIIASGFALVLAASTANAQATRTWVSGVGDDLNPCSRTAPCKTFAGAISKTATNGEINCLDPGAFGAVTITKAISIICQYTEAGALATLGSNDIVVNAPSDAAVYLSGLDLQGANTGLNGVRFIAGKSLTIENSIIRNFGASNGQGVSFQPSGTSSLLISNTSIVSNGSAATGGGVLIAPTGAGVATATLDHVRVAHNAGAGILINGASTVMIANSTIAYNANFGIRTASGSPTVRVGTSVITGNGTGVSVAAGTIESYCTNQFNGNSGDGAFFGACLPMK